MTHPIDITEGIPYTLSNPNTTPQYNNTGELYDIAIGGQPFFLNTKDDSPYRRVTAKYRKDQYDTTREPGEQSLTGWWVRSQSSFHMGAGIKFFEPLQDETLRFRFKDSRGVDVWTQGQVTLLHDTYVALEVEAAPQIVSCKYEQDALLVATGSELSLLYADDSVAISYSAPSSPTDILSLTTDGTRYFYADATRVFRGNINASTAPTKLYEDGSVTNALIRYVKQRLLLARNTSLYELNPNHTSGTSFPTAFFTHPSPDWKWTAIAEGPQAIYVAGYNSTSSSIFKITLDTANANALGFPELNVPTVVADLPAGEIVKAFDVYLGTYAVIVTNKGVRVGVANNTGDIAYGPVLFNNENCTGVAFRERFAYISTMLDGKPGLYRVDLSMPTSTSAYVFAYASDLVGNTTGQAYGVAFYGESDKAAFTTATDIWAESDTDYVATGWLQTGFIRYNTLENKVFKYVYPRINLTDGGLTVKSVDQTGSEYPIATFAQGAVTGDTSVLFPQGPQEYLGFKFTMTVGDDVTDGPVMTGYQVKSLPAIPRQRMIQYPVMFYDNEMDAVNNQIGYEGRTWDRLQVLEQIEDQGDTIRVQDFRTGESYVGLIEEIDFINMTPTDKRFSGFGGILLVTIRKVS